MAPHLIGLYSPAPQSGKTTVARYLAGHGFYTVPMAGPLKRMTRVFLELSDYGPNTIEELLTANKEERLAGINVTPRHLMQTLGTEWGRACVHPDVWVQLWETMANRYLSGGDPVVVDDVRFPNEADMIRSLGGELWSVYRPGASHSSGHASEGSLDDYPDFTGWLINDSSLLDLYQKVEFLLE
jgi:hypothetical protein